MAYFHNSTDINQTFIIEPLSLTGGAPTVTACTAIYSNALESCSGDTTIFMGSGIISFDGNLYTNDDLTANQINATTFYSGGTNLINIINSIDITGGTFNGNTDTLTLHKHNGSTINVTGFADYYTTGTTLIGKTVYFDRNDHLSAYTLDLSTFSVDTFTTGLTFNNNEIIITRNDGVSLNAFVNTFTGLTVNGLLKVSSISATTISATTFYGDGSHLTGISTQDSMVTGGTYSNGVTTFINNTGGTFSVSGYSTGYTLTTSAITETLGYVPLSAYTDTFVTGGTISDGVATFTNNSGGSFNVGRFFSASDDIYTTRLTFNPSTYELEILRNDGVSYVTNLSILATDMTITGGTYNINTGVVTFTNNTGGTFSVTGFSTGMTDSYTVAASLSGETIQFDNNRLGPNLFNVSLTPLLSGKTNNTIFVEHTGNTNNPHQTSFGNLINTAHTHTINDVIGLSNTLNQYLPLSGGSVNYLTANIISAATYYNLPQDVYVTGTSFNTSSKILRNTRNDNTNIDVLLPVRTFLTASTTTSSNTVKVIDIVTGLTNNSNSFVVNYISAYKDNLDYGFWKRTLAVNKVSGLVTVIGENSDFDRISTGMTPNNVIYSGNNGNLAIVVSGETTKNYTWSSNWEIIR